MSICWLMFASATVVGSLLYNIGMKFGSASANTFGFALVITSSLLVIEIICCLIAKYGFKVDIAQGLNSHTAKFAVLAAMGAALIDICYFCALRYGSVVASQIFWTIGGMITLAVFATLFLGETITISKAVGIILGIASVFLITR